jgi:hypothetical protein
LLQQIPLEFNPRVVSALEGTHGYWFFQDNQHFFTEFADAMEIPKFREKPELDIYVTIYRFNKAVNGIESGRAMTLLNEASPSFSDLFDEATALQLIRSDIGTAKAIRFWPRFYAASCVQDMTELFMDFSAMIDYPLGWIADPRIWLALVPLDFNPEAQVKSRLPRPPNPDTVLLLAKRFADAMNIPEGAYLLTRLRQALDLVALPAEQRSSLWVEAARELATSAEAASLLQNVRQNAQKAKETGFWPKYFAAATSESMVSAYRELELVEEVICPICGDAVGPGEGGVGPCGSTSHQACYDQATRAMDGRCPMCKGTHA